MKRVPNNLVGLKNEDVRRRGFCEKLLRKTGVYRVLVEEGSTQETSMCVYLMKTQRCRWDPD